MKTIEINNKEYKVKIADTEELRETGLQNVEDLPKNEGMLFVFDEPDEVSFWMKSTPINLDIIFIDEDGDVINVKTGYANTETPHTAKNVKYVLELNQGSGIVTGDEVDLTEIEDYEIDDIEDEEMDKDTKNEMFVLGEDGEPQMQLQSGERIVSRKQTKVLIRKAKKAYLNRKNKDQYEKLCKDLGRYVFKVINAQDERENEYIQLPN